MRRDRKGARSVPTSRDRGALRAGRSRPRALLLIVLLFFVTSTATAQLTLFSFDGTTEAPVGSTYNFGNVAVESTASARFRVFNTSTSAVTLSTVTVSGFGFSITAVNGSLPYPIAPANFLEFTVQLSPTLLATYNANLQINTIGHANNISVILLATAVTPPLLTAVSGCTVSNGAFSFGNVQVGSLHLCNFSLVNPGSQPMLISTIGLSGGFQFQQPGPATPLTLAANQGTMFTVEITPACGTAAFSGSLIVNSQTFPLAGSAITPALAKPAITFDAAGFSSGQQHTLTLSLPTAPPCAVTGNLNLAFTPVQGLPNDASIVFAKGSTRSLQFTVAANSTQVSLAGQLSAVFQTGTTAGTIAFTVTGTPLAADPTVTLTIPPTPISIDLAAASNQVLGELNVEVTGFDNTYSAGAMSFTFFDSNGKPIGSPITADFTSAFKSYFSKQSAGSSFLMQVSFPIQGNQALVSTVQATLTNSSGPAQTGSLTFQ